MSIEDLTPADVCRIKVEPGEVLAVTPGEEWPVAVYEHFTSWARENLPGVAVIVLTPGTTLDVVAAP